MDVTAEIQASALRFAAIAGEVASRQGGPPSVRDVSASHDADHRLTLVFGTVGQDTICATFPCPLDAWTPGLRKQVQRMFAHAGR